jgi:hypothetical protein
MFIVIMILFLLTTLLLIEWRVHAIWLRSLLVVVASMGMAVMCVLFGQRMGETLIKNAYSRYMRIIMEELHQSSKRNEQSIINDQIDCLYERLPHAILTEAELLSLVDTVIQISNRKDRSDSDLRSTW